MSWTNTLEGKSDVTEMCLSDVWNHVLTLNHYSPYKKGGSKISRHFHLHKRDFSGFSILTLISWLCYFCKVKVFKYEIEGLLSLPLNSLNLHLFIKSICYTRRAIKRKRLHYKDGSRLTQDPKLLPRDFRDEECWQWSKETAGFKATDHSTRSSGNLLWEDGF